LINGNIYVEEKVNTNNDIITGDIIYMPHVNETRMEYGFAVVYVNPESKMKYFEFNEGMPI
tara:strand:+ start:3887 stop:4069 length:183 start_codon:yes stop_codon:yes gene_type:complete